MTRAAVHILGFIARGELNPHDIANVCELLKPDGQFMRACRPTTPLQRKRAAEVRRGLLLVHCA